MWSHLVPKEAIDISYCTSQITLNITCLSLSLSHTHTHTHTHTYNKNSNMVKQHHHHKKSPRQEQPVVETTQVVVGQSKNVCCSSPDGARHLLSQVICLMALGTSFAMWVTQWADVDFGCWWDSDRSNSPICFSIPFNSQFYWSVEDDRKGWAGAIRFAALVGVVATSIGIVLGWMLFTSCCFAISTRRLLTLSILAITASVLQLLTLVAGAADPCKGTSGEFCSKGRFRVDTGASLCKSFNSRFRYGL
jgi:hypothetical protein